MSSSRGLRLGAVLAVLTAGAATAGTFAVVRMLAPPATYLYQLMYERSWIQPVTTLCFWLCVSMLVLKHVGYLRERRAYSSALHVLNKPELASTWIWSNADAIRSHFVGDTQRQHADSITYTRIVNGLDRLRRTQSTSELDNYFRSRSELDAGELDTSYSGLRYLVWLIPTLGFIGTVMGVGRGIAGFARIIGASESFSQIRDYLPTVTNSLGTAFDTTLLALGLSVVAMLYMAMLLKQQEQLLKDIDTLCFDRVCALFQEHAGGSDVIVRAIDELSRQIRQSMTGNRGQIEKVLRDELPVILGAEFEGRLQVLQKSVHGMQERVRGLAADVERLARRADKRPGTGTDATIDKEAQGR